MNVLELLERTAVAHPQRVAVTDQERQITYRELANEVANVATHLTKLPLPSGARAAILYTNSIEYVVAYFAVFKAGLTAVPLDTSLTPDSLAYILADCQVQVLICEPRFKRHLKRILPVGSSVRYLAIDATVSLDHTGVSVLPFKTMRFASAQEADASITGAPAVSMIRRDRTHELAAIFYTSGSTGASKGVMLSHLNLVSNTLATVEYLRLTSDDSVMVILPFYYIYGNSLLLTHVAVGGRCVIDNRFMYPEVVLDTMGAERVTGFSGVPSNFMILLNNSTFTTRKLESLRYFTQAGGAMAPEVTRRLMDAFPHKQIFIMYGQTEASPRVSWLPPERLAEKLGSAGIEVPGAKVTIRDDQGRVLPANEVGELVVEGDLVMMGYWNQPEESRQVLKNDCLYTGDLARMDTDGYIFIVGRKKEIIKTGGNRVSAKEVEECLLEHQKISEASIIGVPDDILGEAIRAVIVLKPGMTADTSEIKSHCKRKLADFKVPKQIRFVEQLPKYQSGKVNKMALKEQS
ncbi:MAG: class I adenylate-forming enzyme family protein [Candidatus Zixiibacteriota bacterium]